VAQPAKRKERQAIGMKSSSRGVFMGLGLVND
jgi:hypothetical protein